MVEHSVELPDEQPTIQERAVIAVLEFIHDEGLWNKWEYFKNDDLLAARIREVVETRVAALLSNTHPQLPASLRRVVADWMVNISWLKVGRAVRERYGTLMELVEKRRLLAKEE
jgi:hypothetical protein